MNFRKSFQKKIFSAFSIIICLCMICGLVWAAQITANAEVDPHSHCVCGGSVTVGGHSHDTTAPTWTAWDGASEIQYNNNTAYVYLTANATPNNAIEVMNGNTLNLCLNGNTLNCAYTVFSVKGNATLNICDCKGTGKISSSSENSGHAIYLETTNNSNTQTTLNLYGGEISGKYHETSGAGTIYLKNNDSNNEKTVAVFNLYGGTVSNSSDYQTDSAVYASYANIGSGYYGINIYGGSVTCQNGYGIHAYNSSNAKTLIAGGTVSGKYTGVSVLGNLTLSGRPVIAHTGNSGEDINITTSSAQTENNYITVTNDFSPTEGNMISVGVPNDQLTTGRVIARPGTNESLLTDKAQYFVSSAEGYFVECNTEGNLQLSTCKISQQPAENNSYTVTASGGTDAHKVKYQWYSATRGDVAVTDKNAAKGSNSSYRDTDWNEWYTTVNPTSSQDVTWDAFTLHMAEDDVLTVKYQVSHYDGGGYLGSFKSFELKKNGEAVQGDEGREEYYTTYTFKAPSEGEYTLTATATPGSYTSSEEETNYNLYCTFSATVTADVAETALNGQTAATLITTELANSKYLCAVTWEGKTTLYSNAVDFSAPKHTHCICGEVTAGETTHSHDAAATWEAVSNLDQITKAGNYYLTGDVTLPADKIWNVNANVNLCLNGFDIIGAEGINVITVGSGGSLTVTDCKEEVGEITHADNAKGRGIENQGTLTLWNGSISGNSLSSSGSGGGVYNGGTFYMYGGNITDNYAYDYGGGVYNYSTNNSFTMSGGTIARNTAYEGGGVYIGPNASFTMSGGVIGGNSAADGNTANNSNGGGVSNDGGTFIMKGNAKISYNTAYANGGGVYYNGSNSSSSNSSTFELSEDAVISHNTADGTNGGGGVYSQGNFTMTGGSITDNNATYYGGGVFNYGGDYKFVMTRGSITKNSTGYYGGGVYNGGNFEMSGGNITQNRVTYYGGGGVFNYGTLKMSGIPIVSGNKLGGLFGADGTLTGGTDNNVYVYSGQYSIESTGLNSGASVGITGNKGNSVVYKAGEITGFFSDNTDYELVDDGSAAKGLKLAAIPVTITGADDGKTYCGSVTLTVTKTNLAGVTLNGESVTLTEDGKLTLEPKTGEQTVIAIDRADNKTSITITVNNGHTWNTGIVTTEPTYTQEGVRTYTCTVCDATKTESIAKLPSGGGSSGGGSSGGGSSGGGSITLPSSNNEDNIVNKTENKTTGTAATTTATVTKTTTTTIDGKKTTAATVDTTTATKIIEKAVENKSAEVVIDTATAKTVTETAAGSATEIALPEKTVQELSEKTEASVTIRSDAAEVTLNKAAVDGLASQAGDDGYVRLVVETVKQEPKFMQVDLKLVTSKGTVTDFRGGNVAIKVKMNGSLASKELVCVYIDNHGKYSKVTGTKNSDGTYTFITGHFSSYAIMALDDADEVIAAQTAKVKALAGKIQIKARSVRTAKGNIKVRLKITKGAASFKALEDMGYTLKYQFYRSTKKASNYKAKFETLGKPYTNTDAKKGVRYYYKARIVVYDTEGNLVTKTDLKKCWYATRIR